MSYKIEVPIPNNVHFTERTLSGFIDTVLKYKEHISSLYFPLGHVDHNIDVWGIRAPSFVYPDTDGRARDEEAIIQWESALNQIFQYTGLPAKLLLNNIYNPSFYSNTDWTKILKKIAYYRTKFQVVSATVADVAVVPKILSEALLVTLSTNSHNSLQELDMFLTMFGPESLHSVCLQRDLNRNPKKLKQYLDRRPELVGKIVLLVNEGCVNACIYKNSGDVEISMSDIRTHKNEIHTFGCKAISHRTPWLFLTSQFLTKPILEEHYPFIAEIKLAGRNLGSSQIKYMLQHYVDGIDHKLDTMLNVSPPKNIKVSQLTDKYWADVLSCNKECLVCKKCESHYDGITPEQEISPKTQVLTRLF